jgi:hypothetical protein
MFIITIQFCVLSPLARIHEEEGSSSIQRLLRYSDSDNSRLIIQLRTEQRSHPETRQLHRATAMDGQCLDHSPAIIRFSGGAASGF